MKKTALVLCVAVMLFALAFAGCKGADGGKVTDKSEDTPILTQLETELSTLAEDITDVMPDMTDNMTGNVTDTSNNNTTM